MKAFLTLLIFLPFFAVNAGEFEVLFFNFKYSFPN